VSRKVPPLGNPDAVRTNGRAKALDYLIVGAIETDGVAGIVSVGSTHVCNSSIHSKTSTGNGKIIGDFGVVPVWFACIHDSDFIDAPSWTMIRRS
jgi:hypothetical protein